MSLPVIFVSNVAVSGGVVPAFILVLFVVISANPAAGGFAELPPPLPKTTIFVVLDFHSLSVPFILACTVNRVSLSFWLLIFTVVEFVVVSLALAANSTKFDVVVPPSSITRHSTV